MLDRGCRAALLALAGGALWLGAVPCLADDETAPTWLPTGQLITPTAASGAVLQPLNPHLRDFPNFTAGHAVSLALSPDGKTLLALTSGFNRMNDPAGKPVPAASNEYVFVYDVAGGSAVERQVLQVPNTFAGIAFAPDGGAFYVGGGVDDAVHAYRLAGGTWAEDGEPVKLRHDHGGNGLPPTPAGTAGLAVTADGATLVVADIENDAVSIVDLKTRTARDLDLRPGKLDPKKHGRPGGTYPYWVAIKGSDTAYVSAVRDREVVVVQLGAEPSVVSRIPVPGNPNRMILDRDGGRLYVASDNADAVTVIDTASNHVIASVKTTAPAGLLTKPTPYRGAAPDALALSPDETRLYVANGGANAVAVLALDRKGLPVIGLVPTGWSPNAVAVANGTLYVANGKSVPGPNPRNCAGERLTPGEAAAKCFSGNNYILMLEKAGLLSLPLPRDADLDELTRRVAANNRYATKDDPQDAAVMGALRRHIRHVIYIVKENRTYDQVLGDLGKGNGDPSLTEFGRAVTPNEHALAEGFVTLDNFYDTGEVSGNGWAWSTEARESDIAAKQIPPNYARRGQTYDVEGTNRNINVALPTLALRRAASPLTPDDPDVLAGTANVTAPDPPSGPKERGYLWDAALRAGLSVRNYGFLCDLAPYAVTGAKAIPLDPMPFETRTVVAFPANPTLAPLTDRYFRSFDNKYPDLFREREWEREFALAEASGTLPALSLVRLPHDHMGDFGNAIDGLGTPEGEVADNDYAVGLLVERVARSRFRDSTLVFVVEDDAQDGPDHVDAHRSIAFIAGPYVRHGAVVSRRSTTVNLLRTIEDVLGIDHLSLYDAYQAPMSEVFDPGQRDWSFTAEPAAVLRSSQLPLPERSGEAAPATPTHEASWWAERSRTFDFSSEDKVDAVAFNRLVWAGLEGDRPYPEVRSRADLTPAAK